jgi:hypothetical protein
MKKGLTSCVTVLLCAGALIAPNSFAADKFELTASETFDPFGILGGPPIGEFLASGTVKCPGYEPTEDPMQPCPVGSRQHTRDVVVKSRTESSDPAMSGWMTVVLNSNLDADGVGPVWGTFRSELDGGGIWEGTWQGLRTAEDGYWIAPLHVVGKGYGGLVDGMQMMGEDVIWSPVTPPYVYLGSIKVRILDPK